MTDPCPLKISILHRKRENQKSKNMAAWKIRFLRPPCFSKCKFFFIFSDLKLSMKVIFFSKILNYNIINKYYIIDWYFFAQNSRHLRQIPLLLSNFEIWPSYQIWWRSMTIKTKKLKKINFCRNLLSPWFLEKNIYFEPNFGLNLLQNCMVIPHKH